MKNLFFVFFVCFAFSTQAQTLASAEKPPMRKEYPQTKEGSEQYQTALKQYNKNWTQKMGQQLKASQQMRSKITAPVKNDRKDSVKGVKGCTRDSSGLPKKRRR